MWVASDELNTIIKIGPGFVKESSTTTTRISNKAIMEDQLTSAFQSLIIRNNLEESNDTTRRLEPKKTPNNSIRSPRIKGSPHKQKNIFRDVQEPKDKIIEDKIICQSDNKQLGFDTVDHQANVQSDITSLVSPIPSNTKLKTPSSLKTPVLNNDSIKKQPVRSSPRLNPHIQEGKCLTDNVIANISIASPVSLPSPVETPYHTPKSEEVETNETEINNKSVWMTPQIKSRHQKRRINIKSTPEVITENVPDIATSTPFKRSDVLPQSPGLENIYPKESSPSVSEPFYASLQSGYASSEDVLSTETSICSTPSISKANVSFGIAKVYCFDRCFGIDTVPEEGNIALGMSQVAWEAIDCPIYDNSEELSKNMQKLTIEQRRTLLEESCGSLELSKGDEEDDTCRSPEIEDIRNAREQVGCSCIGSCNPATCECALSEINCQVERYGWPCGCTKLRCKNPEGRRQYQPAKIKKETRIKIMQTVGKGKIRRSV